MNKYPNPRFDETELKGQWVTSAGRLVADDVSRRIEYLISEVFVRLAVDASGWVQLYEDPADGRCWELSYPESAESGGGPPKLTLITREDATKKFSLA